MTANNISVSHRAAAARLRIETAQRWTAEANRHRVIAMNATNASEKRINELMAQDLIESAIKLLDDVP